MTAPGFGARALTSHSLSHAIDRDNLVDKDDEASIPPDMRYLPRNVMRQGKHYGAIREVAGKEAITDVYCRAPKSDTWWFVGKTARVSDVSPAQSVVRQWNVIETHACNLRPIDLFPSKGSLEIWIAPGDSELEVAYNRPELSFAKVHYTPEAIDESKSIKNVMIGWQGEVYDGGEDGFRTWRNEEDGSPARPEITSPTGESTEAVSENELQELKKALEEKDINELYKEQERRAGRSVED